MISTLDVRLQQLDLINCWSWNSSNFNGVHMCRHMYFYISDIFFGVYVCGWISLKQKARSTNSIFIVKFSCVSCFASASGWLLGEFSELLAKLQCKCSGKPVGSCDGHDLMLVVVYGLLITMFEPLCCFMYIDAFAEIVSNVFGSLCKLKQLHLSLTQLITYRRQY